MTNHSSGFRGGITSGIGLGDQCTRAAVKSVGTIQTSGPLGWKDPQLWLGGAACTGMICIQPLFTEHGARAVALGWGGGLISDFCMHSGPHPLPLLRSEPQQNPSCSRPHAPAAAFSSGFASWGFPLLSLSLGMQRGASVTQPR